MIFSYQLSVSGMQPSGDYPNESEGWHHRQPCDPTIMSSAPSSDVILNPERSATPATVQVKQTFTKGANKDPCCAPWQETWLECTQPPSKERPKQR